MTYNKIKTEVKLLENKYSLHYFIFTVSLNYIVLNS